MLQSLLGKKSDEGENIAPVELGKGFTLIINEPDYEQSFIAVQRSDEIKKFAPLAKVVINHQTEDEAGNAPEKSIIIKYESETPTADLIALISSLEKMMNSALFKSFLKVITF